MSSSGHKPQSIPLRGKLCATSYLLREHALTAHITNTAMYAPPALSLHARPVAVRHEPHLRAFYEHLLARGKTKLQALVATMRKLLHAIYGMFKHRTAFDGSRVFALPAPEISTTQAAA